MRDLILKEILQEYDDLRTKEREALRQRENQVMDTIPGIADLRRTIIELMAKRSIEIIKNPHLSAQAVDELEERISGLKERKELLIRHGFPADYLPCITAAPNVRILDIEGTLSRKMLLSYSKILKELISYLISMIWNGKF